MKKLKKLLTVFLSVLMMLGTLTTVTGATEIQKADDRLSDAEVAAIIEEAFPEHNMATAKAKNSVSAWESTEDKTLVQNETRKLSNDIEVTYLKYSNDTSAYIINTCNFYTNSTFSVKISIPLENTGVPSVFATSVWPSSLIFSLARRNEGNFFQAVPTTLSSSLAEVRLASLVAWA